MQSGGFSTLIQRLLASEHFIHYRVTQLCAYILNARIFSFVSLTTHTQHHCICIRINKWHCVSLPRARLRALFCSQNFCCMPENCQQMENFRYHFHFCFCVCRAIPYFPKPTQKPTKKTVSITFNFVLFERNFSIVVAAMFSDFHALLFDLRLLPVHTKPFPSALEIVSGTIFASFAVFANKHIQLCCIERIILRSIIPLRSFLMPSNKF